MTTKLSRIFILAVLSFGLATGCKDDDDHDDGNEEGEASLKGDCAVISEACHEHDEGTGASHTCHELAHENDTEACTAKKDECVAACEHAHQ